jgi:hypothetical protein
VRNGYPACVITHPSRLARRLFTVLTSAVLVVLAGPVAAHADVPRAWPDPPKVSGLDFLIVLVLIPLGVAVVISVLAALPEMIRDKGYEPGQSWRSEPEWFGGPRQGVRARDDVAERALEGERGGTSARW